ncbi:MAG TPA: GAF domain-containing protein [Terriglobales bacterium]|nr:GAF domain-containing protein [Terriglobales bacterium]
MNILWGQGSKVNQEHRNSAEPEPPRQAQASLKGLEDLRPHVHGGGDRPMPQRICEELSRIFQVKNHEVTLLWIENGLLKFLFPESLRCAGRIPLSSPSVATHTVTSRRAERFNNFAQVKHLRVFEVARSGSPEDDQDFRVIQKLMSAPVVDEDDSVIGVIQISRKGCDPVSAGPDFTHADLDKLEAAARVVSQLMPPVEVTARN